MFAVHGLFTESAFIKSSIPKLDRACAPRPRVLFAALLAVVGVHMLSGDFAYATCGDYLMDQHTVSESPHGSATQTLAGRASSAPEDPLPCDGPHCRRQSAPPTPSTPSRSSTSDSNRWCAWLSFSEHLAPRSEPTVAVVACLSQDTLLDRIDRPPRA